ncbi:Cytochrome c551 peroxidase precursor [Roseimaritima multifibrata]|uniref:Cytochrome c551 peroxidase n=1 Tax=Roseimaritima multifibrata TaxID=1930274 RepID=A0A517ML65_9BACT|nr:cytochrome c peroxidase [Roseimaritima multifibrata]QDS95622.1 Cytochrome c551 peroxidase precursor [Roseimaritima multifibrata]
MSRLRKIRWDLIGISLPLFAWLASGVFPRLDSTLDPSSSVGEKSEGIVAVLAKDDWSEPIRPLVRPVGLDPAKVQLGRALFNDPRLSRNEKIACSTCHQVASGGDDGLPVAIGIEQAIGNLNSPTVLNCSLSVAQFWDGRVATLEEQMQEPIHNPFEMDANWDMIVERLSRDRDFRTRFEEVYPQGVNEHALCNAIATYERALVTMDAPFDLYLLGEEHAISESAKEGYLLFKRIGCIACHQGRTVGGNLFQKFGVIGEGDTADRQQTIEDRGRFNVTNRPDDMCRFKVPTLRNIAQTAPYFHDGRSETLEDAIKVMAIHQLGATLSQSEVQKIEIFLQSLSGRLPEELK